MLALEFNHDVAMQRSSGRPRFLVDRAALGDAGHLSNVRAAEAVRGIATGSLRQLVQLHLSRDCNEPRLAAAAGRAALREAGSKAALVTAAQDAPTAVLGLER